MLDISLRVAAKTRTKPTAAPSTVYRTNMPLTMASCRCDIFVMSSRYTNPYTALMADMHIDGFDAYHYAARKNTRTLSRPNTDAPGRLGGNGLKRNRRQLQLLRKDSCVIKDSAFRAKYADIFKKQTTKLLSWTWRIRKGTGRYSDKQTTKRFRPFTTLM